MSEPLTKPADEILKPEDAGGYVKMTVAAMAQMRYLGTGPKYLKLSARAVRYRRADLDEWLENAVRSQTGRADGAA